MSSINSAAIACWKSHMSAQKEQSCLTARDINQPQPSALPPGLPFVPRPNPRFDDIDLLESRANSNYHSLQARFQQRFSRGLAALVSYTWSKSIDNASNFFRAPAIQTFRRTATTCEPSGDAQISTFAIVSLSVTLMIFRSVRGAGTSPMMDGFDAPERLANFRHRHSSIGTAFHRCALSEIDNSGTGRSILGFGANDRPNLVGDPHLDNRSPEQWFNHERFRFSAPGFGMLAEIFLRPGISKRECLAGEKHRSFGGFNLQLRAEVFNLFNHPNFNLPDNFLGSPTFGRITSARDPRHLQFGVKLLF